MVDGAAYLMGPMWGMRGMGLFSEERGTNLLDTGSPFYDVYETADGHWVSIGSIEPQFYAQLLELTGVRHDDLPAQMDRAGWPALRERLTEVFAEKTAGGVDRAARGDRRVLRAGAADERGEQPPASRGARFDRRARRHGAAGARTALLAHRGRDPGSGAVTRRSTPTRCSRRTASPTTRSRKLAASGAVKQRSG